MDREQIIRIASQVSVNHVMEVFKGINSVQKLPENNVYAAIFKQLVVTAEISQEEIDNRIRQYAERRIYPATAEALARKLMAESRGTQISIRIFSRLIQAVFPHETLVRANTAKKNMDEALAAYTGKPKS